MTETQWAQPAAALSTEASVGRGNGSGVSLTNVQGIKYAKINPYSLPSYQKPENFKGL